MGKLYKNTPIPGINIQGRIKSIVEGLFPTHPRKDETNWPAGEISVLVTEDEMIRATKWLKANKALGPDGVSNEILKKIVKLKPKPVMDMYNKCITQECFPTTWKTARLVLIRKGNKLLDDPSSYHPLCMLNTFGKLLEKIINTRIRDFFRTK